MTKKQFILAYRFGFAVLAAVAVAAQLAYDFARLNNFSLVNFFSYFTIQSALFAAVVFLMAGYSLYRASKDPQLESLRGAATLYMIISAVATYFWLRDIGIQNTVIWSNYVIHYVFPLAVLFDWLFDPPRRQFNYRSALHWMVYPLLYGAYCVIRSPFAHSWYPYPFLNVSVNGYGKVIWHCSLIVLAATGLAFVVARLPVWTRPPKAKP